MNALPLVMIRHSDLRDSHDAIQAARSGQRLWAIATTVPAMEIARSVDSHPLESSDPKPICFKSGQRLRFWNTADTSWFGWMVRGTFLKRDRSRTVGKATSGTMPSGDLTRSRCKLFGHDKPECGKSFSRVPCPDARVGAREFLRLELFYFRMNQRRFRESNPSTS